MKLWSPSSGALTEARARVGMGIASSSGVEGHRRASSVVDPDSASDIVDASWRVWVWLALTVTLQGGSWYSHFRKEESGHAARTCRSRRLGVHRGREEVIAACPRGRWEGPWEQVERTQPLTPCTLESGGGQLGAAAMVSDSVFPGCIPVRYFWESLGD